MDAAEAARVFAKRQGLSDETIRYATEISLDAERKLGAILAIPGALATGGDAQRTRYQIGTESPDTLKDLGITKKTSARAQKLAALPDETFEQIRSGKITASSAIQQSNREDKLEAITAKNEALPSKRYAVIYADPPWQYEHVKTESRSVENHYPTMDLDDICALPIADIA